MWLAAKRMTPLHVAVRRTAPLSASLHNVRLLRCRPSVAVEVRISIVGILVANAWQWMDAYETQAKYNIAETCCASISIEQLQALSEDKTSSVVQIPKKLDYGAIRGSTALWSNLAALYSFRAASRLPKENILITPGAIAANFLLMYTLVGKGDHVICHYPTYQQLYSVPQSMGAEVSLWKARPEKDWVLDLEELEGLIKPNTKLIVIK